MSKLKEKRRSQILIASLQAIAEKGFHSLTLQDIADYAGVSKGVTNYHFKNKEDVLRNLLEWVTDKIYENEYCAIQNETTALGKLKAYVDAAFSTPAENKRFFRVYIDFLGQVRHNRNFKDINDKFYQNCWSIGEEIVLLGKKEGIFPSSMDTEKASISIRSLIDGCLIQWLMREQEELHGYYKTICLETLTASLTNNNIVQEQ